MEWGLIGRVEVVLAVIGHTTLQMVAVAVEVSLLEVLVPQVLTV